MSKAFTKESDSLDDELDARVVSELPLTARNYVTPHGRKRLADEFEHLTNVQRPALTALLNAASAQDGPEGLEYQTHKRRQRELDRRLEYVTKRIENAEVIDPSARRAGTDQVFFSATVRFANQRGEERTVSIVGVDEIDLTRGYISFLSPLAKALLRAREGDVVAFQSPGGADDLEILEVKYQELPMTPFNA